MGKTKNIATKVLAGTFVAWLSLLSVTGVSAHAGDTFDMANSINNRVEYTQTTSFNKASNLIAYNAPSNTNLSTFPDIQGNSHQRYIENMVAEGTIKWYDSGALKGKFAPNKSVSFIESLAIVMRTGDRKAEIGAVSGNEHWSAPLKRLYNNKDYQSERRFENDQEITRDFAIYLVLRQMGIEFQKWQVIPGVENFSDVRNGDNSVFTPYIMFARKAGVVSGYGNNVFGKNNKVTRWEIATMSWKALRDNREAIMREYNAIKTQGSNTTIGNDGVNKNDLNEEVKRKVQEWLDRNAGNYYNTGDMIDWAKRELGEDNIVYKELHRHSYNYKYNLKRLKGVGWDNDFDTGKHSGSGVTPQEWKEIGEVEHRKLIRSYVNWLKNDGMTKYEIEQDIKNNLDLHDSQVREMLEYLNTLSF